MRLKFFTVSLHDPEESSMELNRFFAAHRIAAVDRQFVNDGANSAWAFCVTYDEGGTTGATAPRVPLGIKRGKVDFKEILSDPEFAVFARLRALRKDRADAEGVPAYALPTREQLAEMVQRRVTTATALRRPRVEAFGVAGTAHETLAAAARFCCTKPVLNLEAKPWPARCPPPARTSLPRSACPR
jgi:superfamily II DNA helicase RecQ